MESTWERRDLPVLDAVVRYFDEHPQGVMLTCEQVAKLAGLDPADVYRALKTLQPTYVRLVEGLGHGPIASSVRGVTDDARRAVGQWPSPEVWVDRLVGRCARQQSGSLIRSAEAVCVRWPKGSAGSPATWRSVSCPAGSRKT